MNDFLDILLLASFTVGGRIQPLDSGADAELEGTEAQ